MKQERLVARDENATRRCALPGAPKKGSIGIANTPLVNVGEEGLSPHKLNNEKVINYL